MTRPDPSFKVGDEVAVFGRIGIGREIGVVQFAKVTKANKIVVETNERDKWRPDGTQKSADPWAVSRHIELATDAHRAAFRARARRDKCLLKIDAIRWDEVSDEVLTAVCALLAKAAPAPKETP